MVRALKHFAGILLASVGLMWAAFDNGYPLIFPDAGIYISSGFTLIPPVDRPIGYGFLIRLFSFSWSLWLLVFVQSFLVAYLVYRVMKIFLKDKFFLPYLLTMTSLAIFSGVSWFSSQIIPDIFLSLIFLFFFVFLAEESPWHDYVFLLPLYFLMLLSHTANFLVSVAVLSTVGIFLWWQQKKTFVFPGSLKKVAFFMLLALASPVFLMFYNQHYGRGFVVNPSSHVFLMARLNESGILKDYLDKTCGQVQYQLCPYRENMPMGDAFIWDEKSPLNKLGWENLKPESKEIMSRIFSDVHYDLWFVEDSAIRTFRLLTAIKLDRFLPYRESFLVYSSVEKHFPSEISQYRNSKQFQEHLQFEERAFVIYIPVVVFSLAVILYFFWKRKWSFTAEEKIFFFIVFPGIFYNAMVMATLSGVYGRYNARMMWLVLLAAVLISLKEAAFLGQFSHSGEPSLKR